MSLEAFFQCAVFYKKHYNHFRVNPFKSKVIASVLLGMIVKIVLVFTFMLICCMASGQTSEDISMIVNKRLENDTDARISVMSQDDSSQRKTESILQLPILLYQIIISPQLKPHCYFHPSCSQFASEAVAQHGFLGVFLGADRMMRCNPMAEGRYPLYEDSMLMFDPVSRYLPDNNDSGLTNPN